MAACFFWQTCSKGEGGAPVTVDTFRNVTIPSEEKVTKLVFLFTSLGTNVPPRWRTLNSGNRRRVSVTIVEASSRAYNTGLHVSRMRGAYMVCVQTHACQRTHAMQAWSNRQSQWRKGSNRNSQWQKGPIATLSVGAHACLSLGSVSVTPAWKMASHACLSAS